MLIPKNSATLGLASSSLSGSFGSYISALSPNILFFISSTFLLAEKPGLYPVKNSQPLFAATLNGSMMEEVVSNKRFPPNFKVFPNPDSSSHLQSC